MRINDKEQFDKENVFGLGNANTAYAEYFIGNSYLNPLTEAGKCPVLLANVTFEPGCRNNCTYIMLKAAEDRSLSAQQGRAGIRRKERKPIA